MHPVLVVDNDSNFPENIEEILTQSGVPVLHATDGRQAIVRLQGPIQPGLLLLDSRLPEKEGKAVLSWLRTQRPQRLPVVMLTGEARPTFSDELMLAVLREPIDVEELRRIVAALCTSD